MNLTQGVTVSFKLRTKWLPRNIIFMTKYKNQAVIPSSWFSYYMLHLMFSVCRITGQLINSKKYLHFITFPSKFFLGYSLCLYFLRTSKNNFQRTCSSLYKLPPTQNVFVIFLLSLYQTAPFKTQNQKHSWKDGHKT